MDWFARLLGKNLFGKKWCGGGGGLGGWAPGSLLKRSYRFPFVGAEAKIMPCFSGDAMGTRGSPPIYLSFCRESPALIPAHPRPSSSCAWLLLLFSLGWLSLPSSSARLCSFQRGRWSQTFLRNPGRPVLDTASCLALCPRLTSVA